MARSSWRSVLPGCCGGGSVQPKKATAKDKYRTSSSDVGSSNGMMSAEDLSISLAGSNLYVFTIAELKAATQSFSSANFLGQGGFGPVYKGFVDDKVKPVLKAQTVAVKLLDLEGTQGHKEWLAEVIFLGQLRHPHLVKLIGYCCEEEQRLLVYEFMELGSLENHLFKRLAESLPWSTRLKIAVGAAKGLSFLHEAEKPVIYRDFKASNILLDSDYKAKLSDFGLAKDGPQGDATHVSTRVMGTHGYAAPEYIMTGHLTAKSDVYSFGVVLLELLSGRKSVDRARPSREQNLVEWARHCLNDARKLTRVMDPSMEGQYSTQGAQKVAAVAYQCLSQSPKSRPHMSTVVQTLEPLVAMEDLHVKPFIYVAPAEHGGDQLDEEQGKVEAKENGSRRLHQHSLGYRRKLRSLRPRNHNHPDVARGREADSRLYRNLPLRHKPKEEQNT